MPPASRVADDHPVQTDITFQDTRWWSGHLNKNTVLDYFAQSGFFDRQSLNAELDGRKDLERAEIQRKLKTDEGIVYVLDLDEEIPPSHDPSDPIPHSLYVIKKLQRDKHGIETILRWYYVMDGTVYEAPSVLAIVQARLKKLGWYLKEAFDAARKVVEPEAEGATVVASKSGGESAAAAAPAAGLAPPGKRRRVS
eukprot:CAMPEP_0115848596 /NCGR_PEP_ID=MMETSP0287-20121206/11007_1 /TAXON_ID=412157 /ORGANISM="Chrysochromulina rotalis, Strain UIO044" /LENGTH=195 /DNA_ID=CAMNT_0003302521 /DNA_START=20 /DNA_END=607 /DNA_ORIENTATION=+